MKSTPKFVRRLLAAALLLSLLAVGLSRQFASKTVLFDHPAGTTRVYTLTLDNFVNCYLVQVGGKWLLIDAGLPGREAWLEEQLRQLGVRPQDLALLIVTHGHFDHAGTAAYFQRTYGTKVLAGQPDSALFRTGELRYACPTSRFAGLLKRTFPRAPFPTFTPDYRLARDTSLAAWGLRGRVYLLPGHTPGSLVVQVDNLLFVSDLVRGGSFDPHAPAVHYFLCDLAQNRRNIQYVLRLPGVDYWFPGHFGYLKRADVQAFAQAELP